MRVHRVHVQRAKKTILRDINLELKQGERLFLLGPNGAGKTTLCRAICGLIPLQSGNIALLGANLPDSMGCPQRMHRIGVLIEQPGLPSHLTCLEWLTHQALLHNVAQASQVASQLLMDWEIPPQLKTQHLSLGMRQRLHLLRTLIHRPEFLIWDEPTATLDPSAQAWLWEKIKSWQSSSNATLIICTHHLEEAFAHADSIAFISQGSLKAHLTPEQILSKYPASRKLRVSEHVDIHEICKGLESSVPSIKINSVLGQSLRFTTPNGELDHPAVLNSLLPWGLPVLSLERDERTLHEIWENILSSDTSAPQAVERPLDTPKYFPQTPSFSLSDWRGFWLTLDLQFRMYSREKRILIPLLIIETAYLISIYLLSRGNVPLTNPISLISMAGLLPVGLGSSLAADSFAGERERKNLEVLFTQPVSFHALLLGKLAGVFVATLGLSWAAISLAFLLLIPHASFANTPSLWGFSLVYIPGALLISTASVMAISSRSRTARTAAQAGGLLLMPIIGITQWLASGNGMLESGPWVTMGLTMLGISGLILFLVVFRIQRVDLLDP